MTVYNFYAIVNVASDSEAFDADRDIVRVLVAHGNSRDGTEEFGERMLSKEKWADRVYATVTMDAKLATIRGRLVSLEDFRKGNY